MRFTRKITRSSTKTITLNGDDIREYLVNAGMDLPEVKCVVARAATSDSATLDSDLSDLTIHLEWTTVTEDK
jgi:hypothetical protein